MKEAAQLGDLLENLNKMRQLQDDLETAAELYREEEDTDLRQWRINSWKNRVAPEGYAFPGDPRNFEQLKYETAELNELGEKLLGLKSW